MPRMTLLAFGGRELPEPAAPDGSHVASNDRILAVRVPGDG